MSKTTQEERNWARGASRSAGWLVVALLIIGLVLVLGSNFYYVRQIEEGEIGTVFRAGKISEVVGPGFHWDFGFLVKMKVVSVNAIPFEAEDEEVLTKDKQRVGLKIDGDVSRPGIAKSEVILTKWDTYSVYYSNDDALLKRVRAISRQAMKACLGERDFNDAVIGDARDTLSVCIMEEMQGRGDEFGLTFANLTIPEVIISDEVAAGLDAIVAQRLETTRAAQEALKAEAVGERNAAQRRAEIMVEQAAAQEEARQRKILARIKQEQLLAEQEVIKQQAANDLLQAEKQLAVQEAQLKIAEVQAEAETAYLRMLGNLYEQYPDLSLTRVAEINAEAIRNVEKWVYLPEGAIPNFVFSEDGIMPTVPLEQPNEAPPSP
jgi:regulator of protease activity HflC (stomatin/prohibitin superfamily)